jgi:hypothetical protein
MSPSTIPVVVSALVLLCAGVAGAQESASFVNERLEISATTTAASSASFETTLTLAQLSPVGSVSRCNDGFVGTLGFWSLLGHTDVPVRLRVGVGVPDPLTVNLDWSGADPLFRVYRGFAPVDLADPLHLHLETPLCSASDGMADESDLIFYLVTPAPDAARSTASLDGGTR